MLLGIVALGCTGPQGPQGQPGTDGTNGQDGTTTTGNPSVSVVSPSSAFLGRTLDLSIAGSGTAWSSATQVTFADPKVTVNKVTAASASGLLVNVTIGPDATLGTTDLTVTDGTTQEVYKGAFSIKAPLAVSVDPMSGVPQGGFADVHVQMLDTTTPFDPKTTKLTLSSSDVAASQPQLTPYALDFTVEADVLAKAGAVDLQVSSNAIVSPAKGALSVVARMATMLTAGVAGTGTISTTLDTSLFQFTPAAASERFVQFTLRTTTPGSAVAAAVLPKSGAYADALATGFVAYFGQGVTSTDAFYAVVRDDVLGIGPLPTPADYTLTVFETACTAANETAETSSSNDDTPASAQPIATLPALVSGQLGYGAVTPDADQDVYKITLSGAQTIHAATGGDAATDTWLAILNSSNAVVAQSPDVDFQEDITYPAPSGGTYYVRVVSSTAGAFDPAHNAYQLFVEVK